ncbi:MAG: HNH endonuclease [Candidatus Krumholzibacteriia bacterium]
MRRYWWVNQNQTFRQEYEGGYLWSPKAKKGGLRNPFYDFMRIVAPGDVILSFYRQHIVAVGIADSHCYEAPKPEEFGTAGANWDHIGWRVDVVYEALPAPLRPSAHMPALRPLLPPKYAPLQLDGRGQQSMYLTQLSNGLMSQLALLIGPPMLAILDDPPSVVHDPIREANPVQERWERRIIHEIEQLHLLPATEREQLIDARVGQGRFRSLVYARERSCRVTRVDRPEHLVASHIKPWRHSENNQRLDPENGLMLTPNVDHLFDRGFISFRGDGKLIYSPAAHRESLLRMGFDPDGCTQVGGFSTGQRHYLEFHQDEIFLGTREAP